MNQLFLRIGSFSAFLFFIGLFTPLAHAQTPAKGADNAIAKTDSTAPDPYTKPVSLEIGGVEVKGNKYSDASAVIGVSGLTVGQKVRVPGENFPRAIRNLWKLKLFTDVSISLDKKIGDIIFVTIHVQERPRLSRYTYEGVSRTQQEDLNNKISRFLLKGSIVTEDMKTNTRTFIENFYRDKGFLDATVDIHEFRDSVMVNSVRLLVDVHKGRKVRIQEIAFEGNTSVKNMKLRGWMKNTHTVFKIFSSSKFDKTQFEEDKRTIEKNYNSLGFRDAKVVSDTVERIGNFLKVKMKINEGNRYFHRSIVFKGNSIYATERLQEILGIEKGDVYDPAKLEQRLRFSQDNRDVTSLYMDNGYLFFRVEPIETSVSHDSIDLELRIFEGPQATIDQVKITGNDRTHEHVIRRELRTKPGQKFSRSDILRSQREIIALGYFNPEKMNINTPVNPQRGTVDIEYQVEEKPSDQLELSAGWGGYAGGIIGTLGVTFNNFSLKNISNPSTWSPLPQGDGQRLSLRLQTTGKYYQGYNFSFTEPWLGGTKPRAFTVSGYVTVQTNGLPSEATNYQEFNVKGLSVGLGSRLKKPDDYFVSQTTVSLQAYGLKNWSRFTINGKALGTGEFNNFSIEQVFSRNSIDNPTFPTTGSNISLSMRFTPPYSLFNSGTDYSQLSTQDRFRFVEYHKWRLNAEWFTPIGGKFVVRASAKLGLLGSYNSAVGTSPFERFQLGGDGLQGYGTSTYYLGVDLISLRGYKVEQIAANSNGDNAVAFNKFTVELRYPFSTNPSSTIYGIAFLEGGNAYKDLKDYNPFNLYKTAGLGARVFLPMFGTLGFDYGFGFDLVPNGIPAGAKWTDYARFGIILGFQPE